MVSPSYIFKDDVPSDLIELFDKLRDLIDAKLVKEYSDTHHFYSRDASVEINAVISKIRGRSYWRDLLCPGDSADRRCTFASVPDMDEVYRSKLTRAFAKKQLYGARTLVALHVDGIIKIPGMIVYRILIPLTSGNRHVNTCLKEDGVCVKLNRGNMLAFDFDRTMHFVRIDGEEGGGGEQRTMLKMHFVVCDKGCGLRMVEMSKTLHVKYEDMTRYIMTRGTNPQTYYEFCLGVMATWISVIAAHDATFFIAPPVLVAFVTALFFRPFAAVCAVLGVVIVWLIVSMSAYIRMSGIGPEFSGIGPEVSGIGPEFSGIRCKVSGIGPEFSGIRCKVSGIGPEVSGIRPEFSGIRCKVSGIGPEFSGIGPEVSGIGPEVSGIGPEVSGIGPEVSRIGPESSGIRCKVSGIRPEVSGIGPEVSPPPLLPPPSLSQ
eukprot:gene10971-17084_t